MVIIHIISTEDTNDFSLIYKGFERKENITILINPTKSEVKKAIIKEQDRIVFIGHGTEWGLLNQRLDGFIMSSDMVQFLKGKDIIGIWCYAGNFAQRYELTGFFTSMFISNRKELIDNIPSSINNEEEIIEENKIFATKINELLSSDIPSSEWQTILQNGITQNKPRFVTYNYEAMCSLTKTDYEA
jgi:hypothetical protein